VRGSGKVIQVDKVGEVSSSRKEGTGWASVKDTIGIVGLSLVECSS
jgi:hypothetical protein